MNAHRRKILAGAALAVVFAGVGVIFAQSGKNKNEDANQRTIEGIVTDENRNPVPRAIVQLKDLRTLQVRSFVSQPQGDYRFAGLRMDTDYELKATLGDQSSASKRVSQFESRKTVTVNLQLEKK